MSEPGPLWTPSALGGDALDAARALLGAALVRGEVVLRITETEAYRGPWDTASHCRMGRTARNAPMWGPAGRAYVYVCYGIHQMLNVVTGPEGTGAAVLIRAAEVVSGHEVVKARRGGRTGPSSLAGPGKLGAALALDTGWSGHELCTPGGLELRRGWPVAAVAAGPRVGISYAKPEHRDAPWRLADANSRWVSHRRTLDRAPALEAR